MDFIEQLLCTWKVINMADIILTLAQIENIFQTQTTKMLGYSTAPINGIPQNQDKVRIAFARAGAPAFKITDNICFLQITTQDDQYNRQRNSMHQELDSLFVKKKTSYTRVHKIKWTCYGSNSFDNIEKIRNGIFLDEYVNTFHLNNLYLILDVPAPSRIPESFNGQWWERSDFEVLYNEKVVRELSIPIITSVRTPQIIINK